VSRPRSVIALVTGPLLSLLAAAGAPARALEARVTLPDGRPVAGATVSVIGLPGAARTGADGRFSWVPDPPLPFLLLVILEDGRALAPLPVERLDPGAPIAVTVDPSRIETVTVLAGAAHITAPPGSAPSTVAREDLEARRPQRLADVLENVPGVGRLEEGASVVPSIRGLARGRTLLLIDGARVTAERRAGPSASFLDPFFLEAVEVARGPGSVAYGSDAFGGIIEARTRRPEPGAAFGGRAHVLGAAGLPERTAGLELSGSAAGTGWLFQARGRSVGDYRSPEGKVADSSAEDHGLLLRAARDAGPGRLSVGLQADAGRDIGKPSTEITRSYYPEEDARRLTIGYDLAPARGPDQVGLSAFLGSYDLATVRDRPLGTIDPRRIERSDVTARDFGVRTEARSVLGRTRLDYGLDLNGRFDLEARTAVREIDGSGSIVSQIDETAIGDARRADRAAFVAAETQLTPFLSAAGGLRFDAVETRNRGGLFGSRATSNAAVSGHAALTATLPGGLSGTLQAARGFRDPSLSDRYFRGVSGRGIVTGNPDLEPERSTQIDAALRFTGAGRLRAALYLYQYRIEDLIERFETAPSEFAFRNRGTARLRGAEFEVEADLPGGVALHAGAQAATGRALDDGSPLADIPPRGLFVTARRAFGPRFHLWGRAAAYARDRRPGPTETATPGYAVFDLGGGVTLRPGAELRLVARNLADRSYPGSPDARAVLAPGRSATLSFEWSF
jgi:hemoglobin/transferrin/lactoferrin receptor protein